MGELAGTGACRGSAGWFEWLLTGEHVPGSDEHLASDGGLGGVGFAVPVLGVGVEPLPRGWSAARPAAQPRPPPKRSVSGPAFEIRPVRLLVPDCLIVGASPE